MSSSSFPLQDAAEGEVCELVSPAPCRGPGPRAEAARARGCPGEPRGQGAALARTPQRPQPREHRALRVPLAPCATRSWGHFPRRSCSLQP